MIKISHDNKEKEFKIRFDIRKIQHKSSLDKLGKMLIDSEKVIKDFFNYENLILIDVELTIIEEDTKEEANLKYQILLEKTYYADKSFGFSNDEKEEHLHKMYMRRLTHISEIEIMDNISYYEILIAQFEKVKTMPIEIKQEEFYNIDFLNFFSTSWNLEDTEYGLFISEYRQDFIHKKRVQSYEKIIITNEEHKECNSYLIEILPLNNYNYYGEPIEFTNNGLYDYKKLLERRNNNIYSKLGLFKDIDTWDYNSQYTSELSKIKPPFINGSYADMKRVFEDNEVLKDLVIKTIKLEYEDIKKFKSKKNVDIKDFVNWKHWNDDLDADQQDSEFWNQF